MFVDAHPPLTAAMTKKLFEVDFSAKGSPWRDREEVTYIFFADFLAEEVTATVHLLDEDVTELQVLKLEDVLIFFSGANRLTPCGFPAEPPHKPTLQFLYEDTDVLATASTCD